MNSIGAAIVEISVRLWINLCERFLNLQQQRGSVAKVYHGWHDDINLEWLHTLINLCFIIQSLVCTSHLSLL